MNGLTSALTDSSHALLTSVPLTELVTYFSNSFLAGLLLSVVTTWALLKLPPSPESVLQAKDGLVMNAAQASRYQFLQQIEARLNAVTILFLCVGMTGVMILVSNSLARAFAIGAAISLVRFRVRLDKPGLSTALLFSVIVGMACGVGNIEMAWVVAGIFSAIQTTLVFLSGKWIRGEEDKSQTIDKLIEVDERI